MVETDALTGLLNRNYYERRMETILSQAQRVGVDLAFALVDLDNLKKINDSQGHKAGDRVLKRLAKSLLEHARKSDIVVRMGGDEFVVILWNCDLVNAQQIMEKQLTIVKKMGISFSFGVSEWKKKKTASEIFHEADARMYTMKKKSGKIRR